VNHSRREAIMGNFSEPFVKQGRADCLVRLLEKRFGPIPYSLHEQILASDLVSIDVWFDRAMEALFDRPLEVIELQWVFEPKGIA
jgi:hypothetical protein